MNTGSLRTDKEPKDLCSFMLLLLDAFACDRFRSWHRGGHNFTNLKIWSVLTATQDVWSYSGTKDPSAAASCLVETDG